MAVIETSDSYLHLLIHCTVYMNKETNCAAPLKIIVYVCNMSGIRTHITKSAINILTGAEMPLCGCTSQQFRTFCKKLYYFSNFKDFNKSTLAC